MSAHEPAHLLLLGAGLWGRNIVRDLLALGCRVTVVEPRDEARQQLPAAPGVAVHPELPQGLRPDGVVVATPASRRVEPVLLALEYGVPVFCEKPLAVREADAQALVQAGGDRLFVMHVWRYHAGIQALAKLAASSELGPVSGLRTTRTNWTSPRTDVDPIWTLVPHDLSIALAVLGHLPEPHAAVVERVDNRAVGMTGILGRDPWFVFEASTRHAEKRREVRLHCQSGVAVLPNGESTELHLFHDDGSREPRVERRPLDPEPALLRELRAFVEHLQGGPPPPTPAREGLEVVRAVERLRALAGLS